MNLTKLLNRPIAFHRPLVEITGSVTAALMLSQGIYWSNKSAERDGWFYKTIEEWTEETGMTRAEQETARRKLCAAGVWEERHERLKHRKWYRVKSDQLSRMLESYIGESGEPSLAESLILHPSIETETTTKNTGFDLFGGRKQEDKNIAFTHAGLQAAWESYLQHRREKRKPIKAGSQNERKLLAWLSKLHPETATEALDQSVTNGWLGVFEPKQSNLRAEKNKPRPLPNAAELRKARGA